MAKVFITGATGFVGGALARHRLELGDQVYALSRSEGSDQKLQAMGATPVRGELGSALADSLKGMDWVFHCAAKVEDFGDPDDFYRTNVTGTNNLITDCIVAGVSHFLFLSTEAVLLDGYSKTNMTEQTPYPLVTPFLYSRTKMAAEKLVRATSADDLKTYIVRPRMVWGPGDSHFLPELKKMCERKALVWIDKGEHLTSTTHIRNLVHGVDLVVAKGKPGEVYFITDEEPILIRDFLRGLLDSQGLAPPRFSLPGFLVRGLAQVVEPLWVLLRLPSKPPLTKLGASFLSRDGTVDISKAKSELGYRPVVSREEGFTELKMIEAEGENGNGTGN